MMHQTQMTYHITINHRTSNVQVIQPNPPGKIREGGSPPTEEFVKDRCKEIPIEDAPKKRTGKEGKRGTMTQRTEAQESHSKESTRMISPEAGPGTDQGTQPQEQGAIDQKSQEPNTQGLHIKCNFLLG